MSSLNESDVSEREGRGPAEGGGEGGGLKIHSPLPTAVNQSLVTAENNTAFSIQVTEADGAGRRRKRGRAEFLRTPWNQRGIIT